MLDYLFITHLPSFYKVNLYNELAKKCRIHVIFVSAKSSIRKDDFSSSECHFTFDVLDQGDFEKRNKLRSSIKLIRILFSINYKKVVVGGWDLFEFWLTVFLSPKRKNCLALESTPYECNISGLKGRIKRFFVKRISLGFPSGKIHAELFSLLGGASFELTKGVGIFNYLERSPNLDVKFASKFLFVGRFSPEKNLLSLLSVFRDIPEASLSIVGSGPLEEKLKALCPDNVSICPYVENSKINLIFADHDVLILPSIAEPWGLVVDEALYYGLPVIVSNKVGCHSEVVRHMENGLVYNVENPNELTHSIRWMMTSENFLPMKNNVTHFDFRKRDDEQIESYLKALR